MADTLSDTSGAAPEPTVEKEASAPPPSAEPEKEAEKEKKKDGDSDSDEDDETSLVKNFKYSNPVAAAYSNANPYIKAMREQQKKQKRLQKQLEQRRKEQADSTVDPLDREYFTFEIEKRPIRHPITNAVVDEDIFVVIKDNHLERQLKAFVSTEELYGKKCTISLEDLFSAQTKLRNSMHNNAAVSELMEFLQSQYSKVAEKMDRMLAEGTINYTGLWYYFARSSKVAGRTDTGNGVAGPITSTRYMHGIFPHFEISITVIKANGKEFYSTSWPLRILPYEGAKPVTELSVQMLTEETEQKFQERGAKFAKLGVGAHYCTHKGHIAQKEGWWGFQLYKADGRCVVDGISFNRQRANSRSNANSFGAQLDQANSSLNNFDHLPEEKYWMCWPTVLGFSFTAKKWGELTVSNLSDVIFDDRAFDQLVLAPDKKELIKALVSHSDTFADVITGKGGGCIFLLHGNPGVGKTLTAESIAELLHRPLYSVSVGELGTDPPELEAKLGEILEVSASWNAVILLDEADVYLERRADNDIRRNAMVGIFLRLLEYHQGILFLTTNRVKYFDEAFHSRISISLRYDDLDEAARQSIWKNLLDAAGVKGIDHLELGKYDLNGRQIRSMIRLAHSLAEDEGCKEIHPHHLMTAISVANEFKTDMQNIEKS